MASFPTPRLHPNLIQGVCQVLAETMEDGFPADKVIARLFKAQPKWGKRDRGFVAESSYEIIRYLRHYWDPVAPPFDWWTIVGRYLLSQGYTLPDWREWEQLTWEPLSNPSRAVAASIPDWIDDRGAATYGDRWSTLLHALNQPADVILRVNTLKATKEQVIRSLADWGVEAEPLPAEALRLHQRRNIFRSPPFQNGWFEVQDYASQQIAPALDLTPGQTIVDACAGAGGKTLHIASLVENRGRIIALDTHERKLAELRKRVRRAGAHNVDIRPITGTKVIKRLQGQADRVLLDVPCTGLGVLRRNPDTKWRITPDTLTQVRVVQQEILARYSRMVKPGGKMVYATCSILQEENEQQVQDFLTANSSFGLLRQENLGPDTFGYDGFYLAVLERITAPSSTEG